VRKTRAIVGRSGVDGKLVLDIGWHRDSMFVDMIGAVIVHLETLDCNVGMQWG
jgi:hypothetical protein